jgi:DNA-binding PadR family transcriptional regulator
MTDAELAILSIIAESPMAGLDIQKVIDERNVRMWTLIGVESIHYVVEKLEKQGLILNIDDNPPDDRKLRLFRVTTAGMGVLQTALTDLLSTPRHLPRGFDIGLSNLPVLRTSQIRRALETYRAGMQSRRDALDNQLSHLKTQDTPFHILSMFDHQITMLEAEMTWFDGWVDQWMAQAPEEEASIPLDDLAPDAPPMHRVVMPDDPLSFHKHETRKHQDDDVEFPPTPVPRSPEGNSHSDATRFNSPTPPRIPRDDD